jgi:hypothetical protein
MPTQSSQAHPLGIGTGSSNSAKEQNILYLIALVLCTLTEGMIAVRLTHWAVAMPGYWSDAQEFARTSKIADTFTPDFYPALLGVSLRILGSSGPTVVQLLMYEIFAVATYFIFRLLNVSARSAALFAFILSLCPDLLTGIQKVWDIEASCAVLVALTCCILLIFKRQVSIGSIMLTGIVWGIGIAIRPNFPFLGLAIAYAIWQTLPPNNKLFGKLAIHLLLVTIIAAGVVVAANKFAHGAAYWPQNGPYNLFAGANEFTAGSLKSNLNAEPSIAEALQKIGAQTTDLNHPDGRLQQIYTNESIAYIRSHPFKWTIDYSALKFYTMLRPDTKIHRVLSAEGLPRTIVSSAFIVWLVLLLFRIRSGWQTIDCFTLALVVSYSIPFLLTNADPRFGLALNLLLWVVIFDYLYETGQRRLSTGQA